jgi:hypothetical protein
MSTTQFNKEYLNHAREEAKKWHLFLGGTPEVVAGRTSASFDWGRDVNILYKVRESDVNFVTKRIDWQKRIATSPWNPLNNNDNKLIFNPSNNIAYLCLSDNIDNRSDPSIRAKNFSYYIPSHSVGQQTYPDGYNWYALFSVDPGNINLVSADYIPVPTVNDYSEDPSNTSLEFSYRTKCGVGYKTTDGTCCLYSRTKYVDGVGVTQEKGDLIPVKFVSKCYQCYETSKKLNCEFSFVAGITTPANYPTCTPCDCEKQITTKIEDIGNNLLDLNPSGAYRFLYDSYQQWLPTRKGILSIFINLESLSDSQRTIQTANPLITFDTISGSGAVARLKTQPGTTGYYVVGIELISAGSDYNQGDAIPKITGYETNILNNYIEVNVSPEDFPENPSVMLNNLKTCVKTTIDNEMIKEISSSNITQFSKYGLIKDIKTRSGDVVVSEKLNRNEYQMLRATTKFNLTTSGANNSVKQNPYLSLTSDTYIRFSDDDTKRADKAYFKYNLNSSLQVTGGDMEVVTKDYDNFEIGDTLKAGDNFNYVIDTITKPDVAYASGTPLLTQTTSINFPLPSETDYKPKKAVTFTILKS